MLYFVPEILFSLYFMFYFVLNKINWENNKYWIVFLLCVYFSYSSLWVVFKEDVYFESLILNVSYDNLFLKSSIIFIATLGSFFAMNIKDLLYIVSSMLFAFFMLLVNSKIIALIILFLFNSGLKYVKYDEKCLSTNLIDFCLYFLSFVSLFYLKDSLLANVLFVFVLYSATNYSFLNLFINNYDHRLDIFIQNVIKNIAIIFYIFEASKSADVYNLVLFMGIMDILVGCSIVFLQNNIYRMLYGSCMIFTGMSFLLILILLSIVPIIIYYLSFLVSIIPLVAIINYLAQRKIIVNIYDISGIAYKDYFLGFTVVISSLSILGMPFTIGFLNKLIFVNFAISFGSCLFLVLFILSQVVLTVTYFGLIKKVIFDEYSINHDKMRIDNYSVGLFIINLMNVMYIAYLPWFTYNVVFII